MPESTVSRPRATRTRRRLIVLSLAALSVITGVVSYEHGLTVAWWTGNTGLVAYLIPLVPDLMIVTSSLVLLEAGAMRPAQRPAMAMAALAAGIGWTVAQNVAAGARHGPGGALLAAGIPLAFVLSFESMLWLSRHRDAPVAVSQAEPPTTEQALEALLATDSQRGLADALGVPRARVEGWHRRIKTPLATVKAARIDAELAALNGSDHHE